MNIELKKVGLIVLGICAGSLISYGVYHYQGKNQLQTVPSGEYTVKSTNYQQASISGGWMTLKTKDNKSVKYYMIAGKRKSDKMLVLQNEKSNTANVFKIERDKDQYELSRVSKGKVQKAELTLTKK